MPTSASNKPRCFLICVGSELLRGKVNTHASTIALRLAGIGLELNGETTVGDELEPLTRAIAQALPRYEIVIVTGGLGPTFDDITREAAAAASGVGLERSKALLAGIAKKFRLARYRRMPPANARQADVLRGATPIQNVVGTAPGQWFTRRSPERHLILLPGPPSELLPMLDGTVIPTLKKTYSSGPRAEAHLHFVGVPESLVDHKVRPIIEKFTATRFTILAHLGLVDLDIFVAEHTAARAKGTLARIVAQVKKAVGPAFYGMDAGYPLEKVVGDQFRAKRLTLAVAESCTGGMLAARLTDVPGSSKFFLGGVVSYSNDVKRDSLGVEPMVLRRFGAVSAETARAMAQGVRRRLGSDWGLSITGIAGPDGAVPGKPVGKVFIGFDSEKGTRAHEFQFGGSRGAIRLRSVIAALDILRKI